MDQLMFPGGTPKAKKVETKAESEDDEDKISEDSARDRRHFYHEVETQIEEMKVEEERKKLAYASSDEYRKYRIAEA